MKRLTGRRNWLWIAMFTIGMTSLALALWGTRSHWEAPLIVKLPDGVVSAIAERLPSSGRVQLEAGRRARETGRLDEAERSFLAAALLMPSSAEARYQIAFVRAERGDLEGAHRAYNEAVSVVPDAPEAAVILARMSFEQGDARKSIRILTRVVTQHPENIEAWQALGLCYLQLHDTRRAHEALDRALQLAPRRYDLCRDAARVRMQVGAIPDAERLARAAMRRAPDDPQSALLLAQTLLEQQWSNTRRDEVYRLLVLAQADERTRQHALRELGRAELRDGAWHEAAGHLREACRLDPRDLTAHYHLSQVLRNLRDPEAAVMLARFRRLEWEQREEGSLRGAVKEQVTAFEPRARLARFYLQVNRPQDAVWVLEDYLARVPRDPRALPLHDRVSTGTNGRIR